MSFVCSMATAGPRPRDEGDTLEQVFCYQATRRLLHLLEWTAPCPHCRLRYPGVSRPVEPLGVWYAKANPGGFILMRYQTAPPSTSHLQPQPLNLDLSDSTLTYCHPCTFTPTPEHSTPQSRSQLRPPSLTLDPTPSAPEPNPVLCCAVLCCVVLCCVVLE